MREYLLTVIDVDIRRVLWGRWHSSMRYSLILENRRTVNRRSGRVR